jgi:murein DD-endopeptidase MepM/ murein hydrolase activator NlpD
VGLKKQAKSMIFDRKRHQAYLNCGLIRQKGFPFSVAAATTRRLICININISNQRLFILGGLLTRILKTKSIRLVKKALFFLMFLPFAIVHFARRGFLPVKDRHLYTRSGRLRLRYIAIMMAGFMGLAGSNLSIYSNHNFDIAQIETHAGFTDLSAVDLNSAHSGGQKLAMLAPPVAPSKPAVPMPADFTRVVKVESGDTLSDLVQNASLAVGKATDVLDALKGHIDPKELKVGQDVTMHYKWDAVSGTRWTGMEIEPTPLTRVVLRQGAGGAFKVEKIQKALLSETRAVRTKIGVSIYGDLNRAGVPDSIIAQFIKVYSYSVDFARDIWNGDSVELLYNVNRTDDGQFVKGSDLLYASLTIRGKPNVIIRFNNNGQPEFYDGNGSPIKKALLRTPVDGARVTSGFGMRHHPIQGYNKMHKGIDFGAPTGTPIFAAGDGVVSRAGWFSGFGKYVSIKHGGTYATAYGHMSQIAVRAGQRVRQGQVIGRVGSTGNSTGPHLHFEVLQSGVQINPIKLANLSVGSKLSGKQYARLQQAKASASESIETLIQGNAKPMFVNFSARDN